ncbi:MAG: copper amine oxidase N-terminal domain-containing protein [Defluviitaleaceae bacterium]|nr:copper amine oxidase N-terminal domain-containing protein [Defluviitaleaceae bacterium]
MSKMKKKIAKLAIVALLLTIATSVYANDDYQADFEFDFQAPPSNFLSVSGEIVEVDGDILTIEGEQGVARLNISDSVFVGFELLQETTIGQAVTGYFFAWGAMPLIYPPLYTIVVLVNPETEHHSTKVDLFIDIDGRLTSVDNQLVINTEDSIIVDYDFEPFEGDLAGRNLVVMYSVATRSIPAITNPDLVMVLPVVGITPEVTPDITPMLPDPDQLEGLMPTLPVLNYEPDWANYPIIIEGVGLYQVDFHMTETEVFVPLRRVVETMGAIVIWNPDTGQINVNNITITINSNEFILDDQTVTLLSPAILIGHTTYVPISFFRELMGFNNAYFEGGHVQINNFELMQ